MVPAGPEPAACAQPCRGWTRPSSQVGTQSSPDHHAAPTPLPRPRLPTHQCSSPLPKLRIISEPGFPGRQQFLQECPRLPPGGLAQAHEAVESRLAPKQSEHKDAREKPQAYPPADRRGRQPSLQFTQDPRAFVLSSAIRPVSRGKAPFIPLWTCAQLSMARSGQLSRWAGYPPVAEGGGDPLQSAGLSAGVCTDPST